MPDPSFSKEIFPNIQSAPPLMRLEAIASCPIGPHVSRGRWRAPQRMLPGLFSSQVFE